MMPANRRAFLFMLRWCEGTSGPEGYRTIVGGELFNSYADHPRITKSGVFSNGKAWRSSAAGAYQFLETTWDDCRMALGLTDFSPESQDKAAEFLIKRRGALEDVDAGRLALAIQKCNREWASLPGSPYGQPVKSYDACSLIFERAGGILADSPKPKEQPASTEPTIGEKIMAAPALLLAAAQTLLPFIADLMRERGTKTATRNADLLEKSPELVPLLIEMGRTVVPDAKNEQDMAEKIAASKELQTNLRAQAAIRWADVEPFLRYESEERAFARAFNKSWDGDRLIFGQFRFVELLSLILLFVSSVGGGYVLYGTFPAEMKGAVITLMLIAGFTGVKEFWLGSSRDSQRKTELLTEK